MNLADLVRRGLKYVIAAHPSRRAPADWEPPQPVRLDLYADPFADPDWRLRANLPLAAESKIRYGK